MSLTGCKGFEPQRFRPEKCLNCFLPKAVHAKKIPPTVSPRPGRKSVPEIHGAPEPAAAGAPEPHDAAASVVYALAPPTIAVVSDPISAPAPVPVAALASDIIPDAVGVADRAPPAIVFANSASVAGAGSVASAATPAEVPASAGAGPNPMHAAAPDAVDAVGAAAAAAPKLLVMTSLKCIPKQTMVEPPPAAALVAPPSTTLAPKQIPELRMSTIALHDRHKRRDHGAAMTHSGTLVPADQSELGEITGEVMRNYELDYTLDTVLGEGGYGKVYMALPKTGINREPLAIKILSKSRLADPQSRDELRGEISIMHLVANHHKNNFLGIVRFYETRSKIAIVSEMCQGDMTKLIDRCTTERMAARLFAEAVGAIGALHSMGVIHRDIKPENFLVGMDGKLRLCDFGLAVPATDLGLRGSFKEPGQAKGTLPYVPPEAFCNEFSFASDMWACGVLLHFILIGLCPFSTYDQICSPQPFDASLLRARGVSSSSADLVAKLLSKDVTKRPLAAEVMSHPWMRKYCTAEETATEDVILSRLASYGKLDKVKRGLMKVVGMTLLPSEIALAGQLFMKMDQDNSMSLSLEELKAVFIERGVPAEKIAEVMAGVDLDGDQTIDYDEFITAAINHNLLQREENLRAAFRRFDVNRDGKLSRQELIDGFKGTHTTGFTEAEIDTFLQRYDKDQSNSIDYDEFVDMMAIA